jgi:hypothetical protein
MISKTTTNSHKQYFQPRCKVCKHSDRAEIDLVLATRHTYVRIGTEFDLPYRSLANHYRKHLDFEDPTIKKVIEKELAVANKTHELGVEVAIERRLMLDRLIQFYYECLISGRVKVVDRP